MRDYYYLQTQIPNLYLRFASSLPDDFYLASNFGKVAPST